MEQPFFPRPRGPAPAQYPVWDCDRGVWHDGKGKDRPAAGAASSRNEKDVQQRRANKKRRHDDRAERANELQSRWLDRDVLVAAARELSSFDPPSPEDFDQLLDLVQRGSSEDLRGAWEQLLHRPLPQGVQFVSSSDEVYVGFISSVDSTTVYHGHGACLTADGSLHDGTWIDGVQSGPATFRDAVAL